MTAPRCHAGPAAARKPRKSRFRPGKNLLVRRFLRPSSAEPARLKGENFHMPEPKPLKTLFASPRGLHDGGLTGKLAAARKAGQTASRPITLDCRARSRYDG